MQLRHDQALSRPRNFAACRSPDAAALAASIAFGIARNRAFVDGNKRTAWVLARLFLSANHVHLIFNQVEAIAAILAPAAGHPSEEALTDWFREGIRADRGRAGTLLKAPNSFLNALRRPPRWGRRRE